MKHSITITKLLAYIAILSLAGCATTRSSNNIPSSYKLNSNSHNGLLLASVTYHGSYSGYSMTYRKVGSSQSTNLTIGSGSTFVPPGMMDWDIEKHGLRGNVFAVALPAGEYEISSWLVSSGYASIRPGNEFTIRFQIVPGQAVYLGNFHFIRSSGFGGMITDVDVGYSDESSRDIAIIKQKYRSVEASDIYMGIENGSSISKIGGTSMTDISYPATMPVQ